MSVSARSFPFIPACPGQYTHRSFGKWMSTMDTLQSATHILFLLLLLHLLLLLLLRLDITVPAEWA